MAINTIKDWLREATNHLEGLMVPQRMSAAQVHLRDDLPPLPPDAALVERLNYDPLSPETRAAKRNLMFGATVSNVITLGGTPEVGITFPKDPPYLLPALALVVVVYFAAEVGLYAWGDLARYRERKLEFKDLRERLDKATVEFDRSGSLIADVRAREKVAHGLDQLHSFQLRALPSARANFDLWLPLGYGALSAVWIAWHLWIAAGGPRFLP